MDMQRITRTVQREVYRDFEVTKRLGVMFTVFERLH